MVSRIGKYTIEAELGRGGFGQVYKAWDPDVRQPVAIKVLLAEGDPDLLKRFHLEVVTTASLHHKNIVTIHASGEEDGTPYLVMELLEGQTLSQIIKQRAPLSLTEKVRIMTQAAEGLAFAHSKGVVHRDVKPANIMLQPDGSVKIMDFGIALAPNRRTASMTMQGLVVGTAPYMSPEQFNSDAKANEQTDIFSFGDVCYELLTGKHPFEPFLRDLNALAVAILTHDPPAVSQLAPECPEALELLVHRCLAKEREFRYQTFEELRLDSASILVDLQHDEAAAILSEAPALVAAGDLQEARAKVRAAQQLEPGNRQARQLLETIDQKLQEKLNRDRIVARLKEAEQHLSERRFAEAVHVLETAAKLDSGNVAVQRSLAAAKEKLEAAVQVNRLVEDARARQHRGELAEALERLNRALEIDPEHIEARRLSTRVTERLTLHRRDQVRQQAVQAAAGHLAAKRYAEALAALNELDREQPGGAGVAGLRQEIERERAAEERRVRTGRFNLAFARTRETLETGDLERAGQMLAYLSTNFASDPAMAEALSPLRERLDALLRAREMVSAAPGPLARAANQCRDEPEVRRQRASAHDRELSDAAAAVRKHLERYAIEQALAELSAASARYPDDSLWAGLRSEIEARRDLLRQQTALAASVRESLGRDDIRQAASKLAEARAKFQNQALWARVQAEIDARQARLQRQAEIAAAVSKVRDYLKRGDLKEAAARLRMARESDPDERIWISLQAEIDARR